MIHRSPHRAWPVGVGLALCLTVPPWAWAQDTAAGAPEQLTWHEGVITIVGPARNAQLFLKTDAARLRLTGPLAAHDLLNLAAIRVRLGGAPPVVSADDSTPTFQVTRYVILDIGGGVRPLLGVVKVVDDKPALCPLDAAEQPIETSVPPSRAMAGEGCLAMQASALVGRLKAHQHALIWAHAKEVAAGTLKLMRFGVLRSPYDQAIDQPPPGP